jgi:AAA domain
MDAIGTLYNEKHDFKTLVVDSLDWAEPIIHAETARINGWKSIDDGTKETAFQRGYKAAADTWKILLEGLTALRDERDMAVVMLAHSEIKRFESPEADAFDRYQPKLHKDASAIIRRRVTTSSSVITASTPSRRTSALTRSLFVVSDPANG